MDNLPQEIIDNILIKTKDINAAVAFKNDYVTKQILKTIENPWETYIKEGNLKVIQYLRKNNIKPPSEFFICRYQPKGSVMDLATYYGKIEIVKYIHENNLVKCTENAMDMAAENGHFEVIKYLHENKIGECPIYTMDISVRNR